MKYVYGPVPSRRLGKSLGIDTIPLKTCNWNCVYCQLGRTRPVVNERKNYYPPEEIIAEVRQALNSHQPGEIDWVTFVGSGEPTLHASIGWLIRKVKQMTDLPVAVITNGSLLYLPDVREALMNADAVLPSLDAGTAKLFKQINRPYPVITFERLLHGLLIFQRNYWRNLWIEVMLVRGLNDTEEALEAIADALQQICPDEVHLNLPTRPPVETWVQPPDEEGLMRAKAILGKYAKVVHPIEGEYDLGDYDDLVEAILGIITRHPMQAEELERTLVKWAPGQVYQVLEQLENSEKAQVVERYGVRFWCAHPAYYPDETRSQRTKPGSKKANHAKLRERRLRPRISNN
jgi:wyosine [tRNA(Phe)-imidazoG37] synthetase (radical SAM superfamily)